MQPSTYRKVLFRGSAVLLLIGVVLGYRVVDGIWRDFYWTPKEMALTPEEARARVEIYVGSQLVRSSTFPEPVRVRLNNVAEVTRGQLALAMLFLGAGAAMLVSALAAPRSQSDV